MSILSFLLDPGMTPFTAALAFVAGLLLLEIVMMTIGASLMGDGPDADFDADVAGDFDADLDADFDADVLAEPGAELDPEIGEGPASLDGPTGIAGWLGFGQVPLILWLAGMLTAFGIIGYTLQLIATNVLGGTLPAILAAAIVIVPSVRAGRWVARTLGRLVPKTETSAINRRSLGGRRGVIAQGTARRGHPAQARVRDGYGNLHYVRVEPVDDDAHYPTGTEVLIRDGRGTVLLALSIDDTPTQ